MSFRLQNLKYLLTWPQARDINFEIIHAHLQQIEEIEYAVITQELHEDGNEHYHAVVIYKKKLNSRMNLFSIEENVCNVKTIGRTKRDLKDSIAYVKKDGNWKEYGTRPDVAALMDKKEKIEYIREHTFQECAESGLFSISELSKVDWLKSRLKNPRENRERIVYWFYGPTGSGKTRKAWEIAKEHYTDDEICVMTGNNREFKNGYHGNRCVIFDDFRNGDVRFNELLALCDRYPVNVNIKGSHCAWRADMIIFTCPFRPEEVFVRKNQWNGEVSEREDLQQLLRRITEIREFP